MSRRPSALAGLAVLVAMSIGCGGGEEGSEGEPPGGETTEREAGRKSKTPTAADRKRYSCPGEVKLSPVISASKITTIGVPCDQALKAIEDTSEAGFTCSELDAQITCRKGGILTLEYVQR